MKGVQKLQFLDTHAAAKNDLLNQQKGTLYITSDGSEALKYFRAFCFCITDSQQITKESSCNKFDF
jgi:hypothetical protein